jgi:hypothetical protein
MLAGHRDQCFAITEPDLQHDRRAASEDNLEIDGVPGVLDAIDRPKRLESPSLRRGQPAGSPYEAPNWPVMLFTRVGHNGLTATA